jgi:hypothetical protein
MVRKGSAGFLVAVVAVFSGFAQSVNISGTVSNSGGQAVPGAVIKIFNTPLACTSKTDGTYLLSGQTGIQPSRVAAQQSAYSISYKNRTFVFTVPASVPATIKLFDMRGRIVAKVFSGNLGQGATTIPFSLQALGHGMLVLRIAIGAAEATSTLISSADKNFTLSAPFSAGKLSKKAAIDWLQASKAGYATYAQSIDAYTGVINITLGALPGAPNFGPNVKIFDPTTLAIQTTLDGLAGSTGQFSTQRTAYLFKPGNYSVTITCNYYIQALGLGMSPDETVINGAVQSRGGGSLVYFWRGAENMQCGPATGANIWAVSQAAPFRRMHVRTAMSLADGGSTSGGWMSDCKIDGAVSAGSQQQWYTRNSIISGWNGGAWNMFFHGVTGAPAENWPGGIISTVAQVPLVREKPFLTIDGAGNYSVFVPALRTNSSGTTWSSGTTAGVSMPIDQFYIALSATDNATTINAALAQGKNLLLTPGIYNLAAPIEVTRPNTVVLGIGFPSIVSQNGSIGMKVADVDGITIAGLLFDPSGATECPVQLQVGEPGSTRVHASNPTCLFDIFSRIGGYIAGKVATSVIINSNNVIFDHCWIWRADHGTGVGWTSNTSKNGMIINGNDVICYGQFMEHHQQYQTIWRGDRGRNYFYQNEIPYEVPDQASFQHDGINGWASYKVGDSVTTHECWAAGV